MVNKEDQKTQKETVAEVVKTTPHSFIEATGRRKTSTARIRLWEGKGNIVINGKPALDYFKGVNSFAKNSLEKPFLAVGRRNKFDGSIKVVGGGIRSQVEAIMHGIARALNKYNPEEFHKVLKKHELLTRDPRMKERRKFGFMGARRKKASPKR